MILGFLIGFSIPMIANNFLVKILLIIVSIFVLSILYYLLIPLSVQSDQDANESNDDEGLEH